jgi:hypothetical protein
MNRSAITLLLLLTPLAGKADDIVLSFPGNGELSWNGSNSAVTSFRVEWAPGLAGPWFTNWPLVGIPTTNGPITVQVPMFYRVVGVSNACPSGLPGDCCADATPITAPGSYAGTTVGYLNDAGAGSGCVGTDGRDRFYALTIPAGEWLTVMVSPDSGGYNPSLSLQLDCPSDPRTCLAGADAGFGGAAETLQYFNNSAAPLDVLIVVDSASAVDAGGTYMLSVSTAAPVPGDRCENAITVSPGTLIGQSTAAAFNDHSPSNSCLGLAQPGRDLVYSVEVPSGMKLTVVVAPQTSWDPSVYLVDACGPNPLGCLAGSDTGFNGDNETVMHTNLTGNMQTIHIIVDSYASSSSGFFDLQVAVNPP